MAEPPDAPPKSQLFIVAAVALPVVVVALFVVASVVPGMRVADPQHDLVLAADTSYDRSPDAVTIDDRVREGRVQADVRRAAPGTYPPSTRLFLYDHGTGEVREIPIDAPADRPGENEVRTVAVEGLRGRRIVAEGRAPDGYAFELRSGNGPGLVGEIFGVGGYRQHAVIVNAGRVIPLELPTTSYGVRAIGWLETDGSR
jgi:hypothetical protein